MRVGEWMRREVLVITPDDSLRDAEQVMAYHHVRHVPVVLRGTLVGLVTDRDLEAARPSLTTNRSSDELRHQLAHIRVAGVMRREVVTVAPRTLLVEAARLMRDQRVTALPVLDGGKLVGLLTVTDLLRALELLLDREQPALAPSIA